jgi:PII-like signaling protein
VTGSRPTAASGPHRIAGTAAAPARITSDCTVGAAVTQRPGKGDRDVDPNDLNETGVRVRAYFGERDKHHGTPLWNAFLELLRREGAAGATVTRGLAGYGAHSKIHAASLVDLSSDLPLVLEWIDSEERVARLLPMIEEMLQGGLITTEPVTIVRYQSHRDRSDRS